VERAKTHCVSKEEYIMKLEAFLVVLENIEKYDEVNLFFGDEPFCSCNRKTVLKALEEYGYKGIVNSFVVDENNGEILACETLIY